MEIPTVLSLLSLASQEARLIGDLNGCFNFDHNIIVTEPSVDINRFVANGNQPKTLLIYDRANGSIKGLESAHDIRSKNTFVIVVPESSSFDRNLNLLKRIESIQYAHTYVKLGIFFRTDTSMDDIRSYFLWFRKEKVANVFAATYPHTSRTLNVFTFHSFGSFEVINVTKWRTCADLFPSLDANYHQHTFRVTPFSTVTYERFWVSALHLMNATFTIEKARYPTLLEYFLNGIDVVPMLHSFSVNTRRFRMYPIMLTQDKIVVPEAEPYSGFYSYLRTLASNDLFAYCAGAIAGLVLMLCVCRYIKEKKIFLFESVMDVLNLLINDNGYINYRRLTRAETFVIGPLTFVGFIVVNGYLSNLQSYLTKPALQPQLKTLDDIYNSPLTIAVPMAYVEIVLDRVKWQSTHKDWSDRIVGIKKNYQIHFLSFNTSTSYMVFDNDIDMLLKVQRQANIKGFYDTDISVANSLLIFTVYDSILFFDKLNEIIHLTHSSGLLSQWQKEHFAEVEKSVLFMNRDKLKNQQTGDNQTEFPMVIVYGWIASTVVLTIEIIWAKARQWFQNKFHKH